MASGDIVWLADIPIRRRALFGLAAAAAITAALVGADTARADAGDGDDHHDGGCDEDYEIPDEIGSIPWW